MLKRRSLNLLAFLVSICVLGFGQTAQVPLAPGLPPAQDAEGLAGGQLIAELLLKGPSEDVYCRLADVFFEDSRPIQAGYFFRRALALKPDSQAAKAGLKKVEERMAYLEERFAHYKKRAETGESVRDYCSMAAIRFHLGFPKAAMQILTDSELRHGTTVDAVGLKTTFRHAQLHEEQLIDRLRQEMKLATMNNKADKSAVLYGRMMYISLGAKDVAEAILETQALMPDRFNAEVVSVMLGMSKPSKKPDVEKK